MLEGFRYIERFAVRFSEIDMLRHTNHVAYVRWAETIRCNYFADVLREDIKGERGIIAARLEVDYRAPLEFREAVAIGCRVARFGTKSFDTVYEIWSESKGTLAAALLLKAVAFNYTANRSFEIPVEWRERVAAFEPVPAT